MWQLGANRGRRLADFFDASASGKADAGFLKASGIPILEASRLSMCPSGPLTRQAKPFRRQAKAHQVEETREHPRKSQFPRDPIFEDRVPRK
jgi:hypothetical protein